MNIAEIANNVNAVVELVTYVVILLVLLVAFINKVREFSKKTKEEKIEDFKEWLQWAVYQAEEELGGGTGELKLRKVYDMFVVRFPTLSRVISFSMFEEYVKEALNKVEVYFNNDCNTEDEETLNDGE